MKSDVEEADVVARVKAKGWTLYRAAGQYVVIKTPSNNVKQIFPPEPPPAA